MKFIKLLSLIIVTTLVQNIVNTFSHQDVTKHDTVNIFNKETLDSMPTAHADAVAPYTASASYGYCSFCSCCASMCGG